MPAASDCELIGNGFWGQPVNAISSLAFVAVGLMLVRRRPLIGLLACGTGLGSFLFHGPMPSWGHWAHDVSLAALLLGLALERRTTVLLTAIGVVGLGFALFPGLARPATGFIAVLTVILLVRNRTTPTIRLTPAALVLLAGGVVDALSRTGGPLCDPGSILQGHAVWHLSAALALMLWARATRPYQPSVAMTPSSPST
jgi:hypothetical protein